MKRIASILLTVLMVCSVICAMTITALAKEQVNENDNQSNSVTFDASMSDMGKGSALSEGNLAIIVGVSTAVAFGFGGFFIGKAVGKKKKDSALASGTVNTDENN